MYADDLSESHISDLRLFASKLERARVQRALQLKNLAAAQKVRYEDRPEIRELTTIGETC